MTNFILKPNLPEKNVSLVVTGEMPNFLRNYLLSRGIKIITGENNPYIDSAVNFHIDMSVVHVGGNRVVVDSLQENVKAELKREGFDVISSAKNVEGNYPDDVKLNVALFGNKAIGAFKFTDSKLLSLIDEFQKFNVKQGYAKCSVLPINESAIITDDESIYNTLINTVDTLLVRKGDIILNGHDYGFIGGASAKISKDEIIFFGDIEKHRDAGRIMSFLEKHNQKSICFKGYPLYDIGGLVTLCEI